MLVKKLKKVQQPHWYRQHIGECPVCGRDKSYKERVYGEKPKDLKGVYVMIPQNQTYDWCDI